VRRLEPVHAVNDKIAKMSCRAALFLRTASGRDGGRGMDVYLPVTPRTTVVQQFSLMGVVGTAHGCVAKSVVREMQIFLMAKSKSWNLRLNIPR
jgi:hypothetical protein